MSYNFSAIYYPGTSLERYGHAELIQLYKYGLTHLGTAVQLYVANIVPRDEWHLLLVQRYVMRTAVPVLGAVVRDKRHRVVDSTQPGRFTSFLTRTV